MSRRGWGVSLDTPDFLLETRLETLGTSRDGGEAELQLLLYLRLAPVIAPTDLDRN